MEKLDEYFIMAIIIPLVIVSFLLFIVVRWPLFTLNVNNFFNFIMIILTIFLIVFTIDLIYLAILPLRKDSLYNNFFRKGNIYYHLKKYDAAIYCFNTALESNKESFDSHYGIGNAYNELGNSAEKNCEKMKALDSYNKALKSYEKGMDVFEKKNKKRKYWEAYYGKACLLIKLSRFEQEKDKSKKLLGESMIIFREIFRQIERDPVNMEKKLNFADVYCRFGNAKLEMGRIEAEESIPNIKGAIRHYSIAIKAYDKALNINPNYQEAKNYKDNAIRCLLELKSKLLKQGNQ